MTATSTPPTRARPGRRRAERSAPGLGSGTTDADAALRYRPELDGVRAIAVYLVVAYHAGMSGVPGGFLGVDLFFVLSGFLVTGVILRETDRRGTFSLGGFYARRVRRLLPAAVLVVVVTSLVQLLLTSQATRIGLVGDARAALLYVANWHFVADSRDYFAQADDPSPFLHFWSLAIEEQFYLAFPLLVLALWRWSRRPVRALAVAVAVVGAVSLGLQLLRAGDDATYAYYATDTRVYELAAGVALTLVVRRIRGHRVEARLARVATPAAVVGLSGLLLLASPAADLDPSARGIGATVAAVLLLGGLWLAPRGPLARVLALPAPRWLGQVSYGTYLWHWPVILLLLAVLDTDPAVIALVGAVVATALAALSAQLLEIPVRRSARLDGLRGRGWPVAAAGLAVSVVVALVVVPPVLRADQRPALAATDSPATTGFAELDQPVPDGLDLVAADGDTGEPTTTPCTTDDPDACTRVRGDGLHVLLLGDSQAVAVSPMMEAIARDHDLTLSTNTLAGCPWQAGQTNLRGGDREAQELCAEARTPFLTDVLPEMDVDVVVAAGLSRSDPYWRDNLTATDGPGEADAPADEGLAALQLRTTRETAELVTAAGARLVILHSVFGTDGYDLFGPDPIECLAAASTLGQCAVAPPFGNPEVDGVYDVLAAQSRDVATIDVRTLVCPDRPLCAPVVDDTVIWKDPDHVTAAWYTAIRDDVWDRLTGTGLLG